MIEEINSVYKEIMLYRMYQGVKKILLIATTLS